MPPKPPLRLPVKPPSAPKPRSSPALPNKPARPAPRAPPPSQPRPPASTAYTPPPPRWHQNPNIRSSAFVFWGTNGIAALCAMVWLRDHYIEFQHVRGSSMAPTLSPQAHETGTEDWVLVRPYLHRNNGQDNNKHGIQRGDVVTFWKPSEPREMGIKRVVALEGDEVWPARGYARDPSFRENRLGGLPDGLPDGDENALEEPGKVVVPYGHVWVEGDNWRKTWDSNDFGPISKGLIKAKAVWVWRDWFGVERVGDLRDKKERNMRSRVVEGRSEIPAVFLG